MVPGGGLILQQQRDHENKIRTFTVAEAIAEAEALIAKAMAWHESQDSRAMQAEELRGERQAIINESPGLDRLYDKLMGDGCYGALRYAHKSDDLKQHYINNAVLRANNIRATDPDTKEKNDHIKLGTILIGGLAALAAAAIAVITSFGVIGAAAACGSLCIAAQIAGEFSQPGHKGKSAHRNAKQQHAKNFLNSDEGVAAIAKYTVGLERLQEIDKELSNAERPAPASQAEIAEMQEVLNSMRQLDQGQKIMLPAPSGRNSLDELIEVFQEASTATRIDQATQEARDAVSELAAASATRAANSPAKPVIQLRA